MKATKKILAAVISIMLLLSIVPMAAFAGDTVTNYIHSAAITVTAPIDGEKISFDATGDSENYTVTSVKWNDATDYITNGMYTYTKGTTYTITVELTANENFLFTNFTATINGNTADEVIVADGNKTVTLKYSFVCADKTSEPENPDDPTPDDPTPDEPEEPEPSVFSTVIEKIKSILAPVLAILLQVISHIAGF